MNETDAMSEPARALYARMEQSLTIVRRRSDRKLTLADKIRADLTARGIVLEDGPQGTTWRRAG